MDYFCKSNANVIYTLLSSASGDHNIIYNVAYIKYNNGKDMYSTKYNNNTRQLFVHLYKHKFVEKGTH